MIFPARLGLLHTVRGTFRPRGAVRYHGAWSNPPPEDVIGEGGVFSGHLIVGLTGKGGETYRVEDVIRGVRETRMAQTGQAGSSFVSQRGLWTDVSSGRVFDEESVRASILNLDPAEPKERFRRNVLDLAEALRTGLDQHSSIVEFQTGGVSERTYDVHG